MTTVRAIAMLASIMLIAGAAVAESTFQSSSVRIDGRAVVAGGGGAVFVLLGEEGLAWDAEAQSAQLVRTVAERVAVEHPANDQYAFQVFVPQDGAEPTKTEEETLGAVVIAGGATQLGGALLVRSVGPTSVSAVSEGFSLFTPQTDPRFDQGAPEGVEAGQNPDLSIHEEMQGEYLNSTLPGGVVEIHGDIVLTLYGLDYDVNGEERRTGEFATSDTAGVVRISDERHVLTLTGATLRLRAVSQLYVLTDDSVVDVVGTVETDAGPDPTPDAPGRWTGQSSLAITPAGSLLAVRASGDATTAGSTVAPAVPSFGALGLALLLVCALAIGAPLLWRRRERPDDLQLALLAMEERRWSDALPRLTRLASRRPHDVGVLVDRALCMEQLGRHKEAARAFEHALRASPRHAEAHFFYARTLARLQEREAGLVHLETALELDPRLGEMAHREPLFRGL